MNQRNGLDTMDAIDAIKTKQASGSQQISPRPQVPASLSSAVLDSDSKPRKLQVAAFEKDALTGLYLQSYLCRAIDQCLGRVRKQKLTATLALLQLENFYEIRSWVGLPEADLLLSDIARLLRTTLPKRVLLCRCHNYEFAALLIADCSVNAGLITDKLKQALLSAVSPTLPRQLELKCGVGLAQLESNIPSWPVVFARARHNLGLNLQRRDLPANPVSIRSDAALTQLHAALESPELLLTFQALVRLSQDSQEHYEVRCLLSQCEDSLPNNLLFETAAQNALGEQLDRRVIEQVVSLLSSSGDPDKRLLINLSHNSLVSIDFLRWIEKRLTSKQAIAAQLIFQISETDALVAQHHLNTFYEAMRPLGIKISLSNFGCTPDPLRYLTLIRASYVKLDSTILNKVDVNQDRLDYLNSISSQLHAKQIEIIAPMLESLPILPLLWQANIDFLQGNSLHKPSPSMNYEFLETLTVGFA